ncbi:MAG TPA: hypothetical protein VG125_21555 [Pirellulales bacterium]|jgi:hypothetical protein|nr:hypothetical protein [Pirellulales bacterium]
MVDEKICVRRGRSAAGVLLGLIVVVAVVLAVLWGTGVMKVRHDAHGVQITFDATQAEHAGDGMLDKTGKALEQAGEKLERQAHKPKAPQPIER